ncbi:MAG TPA: tetratricopeptide repeat protein [Acidobacteriota bacterium]
MATLVNRAKIIQKAEKLVKQGRLDAAITEYEKLIQDNPRDWGIINCVGDLYARRGQFRLAAEMFGQVADHYQREGLFLKAIAITKKMQRLSPMDPRLHEKLADLYLKQGLQLEARTHLLSLAKLHGEAGEVPKMLHIYQRLVELDPENFTTRIRLAELYRKENQLQQSFQEYLALGQGYLGRGRLEEASAALEQALELQPDNFEVVSELAQLYARRQDHERAIALLQEQRRCRPEQVEPALFLGDVFLQIDDVDQAERCYREALKIDPRSAAAARSLGAFLLERGELERYYEIIQPVSERLIQAGAAADALSLLQALLDHDPHHVGALSYTIEIHALLGEEFERLDRMRALAEAHLHHQRIDSAREVLRDLVELDPTNEAHAARLRQLTRIGAGIAEDRSPEDWSPEDWSPVEAPEALGLAPPPELAITPPGQGAVPDDLTESLEALRRGRSDPIRREPSEPPEWASVFDPPPAQDRPQRPSPPAADPPPPAEPAADAAADAAGIEAGAYDLLDFTAPVTRLERAGGDEIELLRNTIRENPTDIHVRKQLIDLYLQRDMKREAADEYLAISRVLAEFGEAELQEKYEREAGVILERLGAGPNARAYSAAPAALVEEAGAFFDDPVIFGDLEMEAQLTDDVQEAARAAVEKLELEPSGAAAPARPESGAAEDQGTHTDRLRDVEFYLDNGFVAEARDLLDAMRRGQGEDGAITARFAELEARAQDLAAAQGWTAVVAAPRPGAESLSAEDRQVQELFEEFQRSIHAQLGSEDHKTHYDLGLAYREMALYDEAIREFEIAVMDPLLFLEGCSMLGLCWMNKGEPRKAIEWFRRGLERKSPSEKVQGLLYYLGTAYEQAGDLEGARSSFNELLKLDPRFRDVQKRARALGLAAD